MLSERDVDFIKKLAWQIAARRLGGASKARAARDLADDIAKAIVVCIEAKAR